MVKNIGKIDKLFRVLIAAVIIILFFTGQLSGAAAVVLGILAVILVLTSFAGTCPIYLALGLSTKKKPGLN